jgi:hypothetical protein
MLRFVPKQRCFSSLLREEGSGAAWANLRGFEATDAAISKLQQLKQKFPEKTLRIAVEPGGCHGFQYKFILDLNRESDDM